MNKKACDSASPLMETAIAGLSAANWGHALAQMHGSKEQMARRTLADVLVQAMPANALHEIFAANPVDIASASGFAVMLATMLAGPGKALFLVREQKRGSGFFYPLGLAELGIDPTRWFSIHAPDTLTAMKAAADIARSQSAGAVVVEVAGNPRLLDLTASRRFALAAEKAGTAVLLLRLGARETPSAAYSRWRVAPAISTPLPADAPGGPAFDVTLLRHRRMAAGQSARLIWNPKEQRLNEQAVADTEKNGLQRDSGKTTFGGAFSLVARRTVNPRPRRVA
jgi:protein ImuA